MHPEQIWLFGSRARGDEKPGSDWDLLVVLPDDAPDGDLAPLLAWQLQKGSGVYADVIPLRASSALVGLDVDAQRADADADGDGFAPRIAGGSRSRTNKNAPRTTASETATRMNAVRVVLDPRIEGGTIEGGAIEDLGGGVLFGMPTRYNKGAAASIPAHGGKGVRARYP